MFVANEAAAFLGLSGFDLDSYNPHRRMDIERYTVGSVVDSHKFHAHNNRECQLAIDLNSVNNNSKIFRFKKIYIFS
jgi:hypothetical protein